MERSSENEGLTGFRPLRRGQEIESSVEEPQESKTHITFTRQTQKQEDSQSIFPKWDLLPPKSIIRRKSSL